MAAKKLPVGIRKDGNRIRVYLRVGGVQKERRFPPDTKVSVMQEWRDKERAKLRKRFPLAGATSYTVAADMARYLSAVSSMPSFKTRRTDLLAWLATFGQRARYSIEPWELAAQVNAWQAAGVAASTIRHRKIALVGLWTVLDGPHAPCPARALKMPTEPRPQARGLDPALARRILDAMPDMGNPKRHTKRPTVSLTKLRLRVILTTGLSHLQVGAVVAADFDREARTLRVGERRKGKGTEARLMPLTKDGAAAIAALVDAKGTGPFSNSAAHKSFRLACETIERESQETDTPIDLTGVRPYDLRHTFATEVYRKTGDLKAVKDLLGHTSFAMTERYMKGAISSHLAGVISRLDEPEAGSEDDDTPQLPTDSASSE